MRCSEDYEKSVTLVVAVEIKRKEDSMGSNITLESEGVTCTGKLRQTDRGLFIEIDKDAPSECRRVFERKGFRVKPTERPTEGDENADNEY